MQAKVYPLHTKNMFSVWEQLVLLFLCCQILFCESFCDLSERTLSKRSPPGYKATKKLWWLKEITPDLHVAGGLTERQIKYAADGGFKSIISLCIDTKHGDFGGEYLPTAFEASQIAKLTGLHYEAVLEEDEEWASVEAIKKLTAAIDRAEKPILLHCNRAYTISYTTLLYLANASRHDSSFQPRVNSENFYKMSQLLGFDFTNETLKKVVAEITGEPMVENPPKPDAEPEDWLDYWLAHPIYKNWFTAGQIRRGHIQELEFCGFKSVINMRLGTETDGKPSQEVVTLINVKDATPVYDSNLKPLRQLDSTLKTLVLDHRKEPSYVSTTSDVNYERTNDGEYGDDIGYNADLENEHFMEFKNDINYYHLPIDEPFSAEKFAMYKDKLLEIGKQGPVLVHCASGKRVAFIAVLAAALQYEKDFDWAIRRINEVGFEVNRKKNRGVYEMFSAFLNPDHGNKTEL